MDWKVKISRTYSTTLVLLLLLLLGGPTDAKDEVPDIDEKVDFTCPDNFGYFADNNNCSRYFVCVFGLAIHESCTGGLYFSTDLQTCDWPRNVMCNEGSETRSNLSQPAITVTTSTISTIKIIDPRTTKTTPVPTTEVHPQIPERTTLRRKPEISTYRPTNNPHERLPLSTPNSIHSGVITRPSVDPYTSNVHAGKIDSTIQHATEDDELSTFTEMYDVLRDNARCVGGCHGSNSLNRHSTEEDGLSQDESSHHTEREQNLPLGVTESAKIRPQSPIPSGKSINSPHEHLHVSYDDTPVVSQATAGIDYSSGSSEDNGDYEGNGDTDFPEDDREPTEQPYLDIPQTTHPHRTTTTSTLPPRVSSTYNRPRPYTAPVFDTPAKRCDPSVCLLPHCFCGGNRLIPGGFKAEEIPQIVLITFDDAINDINWSLYESLFYKGRKNPNGCPILATFFVSHEWTDYSKVQTLYSDGHEIASHSITHPTDADSFTKEQWKDEIIGQKQILSRYAGIRPEDIRGMRAPFLQIGGNNQYAMMTDYNFTYDSSMPVYENRPPYWPYTLDYSVGHECMIAPCPTYSYPGIWELPLVMWVDMNGGRCSMADACAHPPTVEGVYNMMVKNFERHYSTNRAPFGLFYHAGWFATPHHREGFEVFLNQLVTMEDVYIVTSYQLVEWLRSPTPLSRIKNFEPWKCNKKERIPPCKKPNVCDLRFQGGVRYMKTCQGCPQAYPWVKNLGDSRKNSSLKLN